jgi:ribonuclease P protein component
VAPARSGRPASGREPLPRASRIRLGGEIRRILREGRRKRSSRIEVVTAPAPADFPRFGTIVPRHGHSVVERNLLRRRLREIGRKEILPSLRECGGNFDVLVRTRPQAYDAPFAELKSDLIRLTERLCSDGPSSV